MSLAVNKTSPERRSRRVSMVVEVGVEKFSLPLCLRMPFVSLLCLFFFSERFFGYGSHGADQARFLPWGSQSFPLTQLIHEVLAFLCLLCRSCGPRGIWVDAHLMHMIEFPKWHMLLPRNPS